MKKKLKGLWPVMSRALFVFFICSLESDARHCVKIPGLLSEKTSSKQRLESVEIFSLESPVKLIKEIVLPSPDPHAESINAHEPYSPAFIAFGSCTLPNDLQFSRCESQRLLGLLCTGRVSFVFDSLVPLSFTLLGQVMDDKPSRHINGQSTHDADSCPIQFGKFKWYHWCLFFLACFFHGAGMRVIWSYFQTNV
jgi:hypothetical protein